MHNVPVVASLDALQDGEHHNAGLSLAVALLLQDEVEQLPPPAAVQKLASSSKKSTKPTMFGWFNCRMMSTSRRIEASSSRCSLTRTVIFTTTLAHAFVGSGEPSSTQLPP